MKSRNVTIWVMLVICMLLSVANVASATIIRGIDIDFVTIGNPINPGDTRIPEAAPYGCGTVGYDYSIGKYEVTNAQWNAFVSAAGAPTGNPISAYNQSASYTSAQQPTNYVSWYEAAQFCNYLTSGDKSLGAYQLGTDESIVIDREAAISDYGIIYVLPTEDEWYKAAYYTGSGYSLYANGTDSVPGHLDTNYYEGTDSIHWIVGTGIMEQNDTFDMMGNLWEWNETLIGDERGVRGGSYADSGVPGPDDGSNLASDYRNDYHPSNEYSDTGFRIASVPEPCTLLFLGLGGLVLRRRK